MSRLGPLVGVKPMPQVLRDGFDPERVERFALYECEHKAIAYKTVVAA